VLAGLARLSGRRWTLGPGAVARFALLGIPAVIVLGNTLTLEQREVWHTPGHIMGLWDIKLRRGYALGSAMDTATAPAPAAEPCALPRVPTAAAQLDLFAEQAA